MDLIIASGNRNKIVEIKNKFSELPGLNLIPIHELESPPEVVEDGTTFEENALKKARAISDFYHMPSMSDDSGLMVESLGGRPGVYSARYGGYNSSYDEKNRMLLAELENETGNRKATFVCAIAVAYPDGTSNIARGECSGLIAKEPAGTEGFGYDPIFFLPEFGKTMAELSLDEKNRISHRAKALEKARELLEAKLKGK